VDRPPVELLVEVDDVLEVEYVLVDDVLEVEDVLDVEEVEEVEDVEEVDDVLDVLDVLVPITSRTAWATRGAGAPVRTSAVATPEATRPTSSTPAATAATRFTALRRPRPITPTPGRFVRLRPGRAAAVRVASRNEPITIEMRSAGAGTLGQRSGVSSSAACSSAHIRR
jgi:hypothetical protein